MRKINKFKKGAASFYIVAISTLILVIIAASFAAVIISELSRTSNDDLAQSAYDSALAGVEDAKLAYYNYQYCKDHSSDDSYGGGISCDDVKNYVRDGECDSVARILGKIEATGGDTKTEVAVDLSAGQYYTCVKMTDITDDVKATLSESNPDYTMRAKFANISANIVKYVKLTWENANPSEESRLSNIGDHGIFGTNSVSPAVVALSMVQTQIIGGAGSGSELFLSDFDMSTGDTTNRGTVFLVPYYSGNWNDVETSDKYAKARDFSLGGSTVSGIFVNKNDGFVKSNDKTGSNKPFLVNCKQNGLSYICEAIIEIPKPVEHSNGCSEEVCTPSGQRDSNNFFFNVSLPYGGPETDFKLEFYKNSVSDPDKAKLDGVQVKVDSTGRANDLYRRVETRLEAVNTLSFPIYAIEALGDDNNKANTGKIIKNITTTCEFNFDPKTCD